MANQRPADTLEQHQHEVCNAFARAAVAMRDAASTAENFSNWFSRVNNLQNVPAPPTFNGFNYVPGHGGPQNQYPAQPPAPEQTGRKRKAADDPEGKRKRKEKKPRDANAPKRPPSPYLLFQNEVRKTIQAQHPDIPYAQVLSEIAKMWKSMSAEEKAPYQASQAMLKAKYEQEKVDYETNPVNPVNAGKPASDESTAPVVSKPVNEVVPATSDDSSDESSEPSSSDDEEDDEETEPVPEPPRKKSKKQAAKVPTPPPAKAGKKKEKSVEGKKKKKTADT